MNRIHAARKFLEAMYETGAERLIMTLEVPETEFVKWQEDARGQKELVYDLAPGQITLVNITGELAREPRLYIFPKRTR